MIDHPYFAEAVDAEYDLIQIGVVIDGVDMIPVRIGSGSVVKDRRRNKITFFSPVRICQIAIDFSGRSENKSRIRDMR